MKFGAIRESPVQNYPREFVTYRYGHGAPCPYMGIYLKLIGEFIGVIVLRTDWNINAGSQMKTMVLSKTGVFVISRQQEIYEDY